MMENKNILDSEVPMGLGMALAKNIEAMQYFASLSKSEQKRVIEATHSVSSKQEMEEFASHLPEYFPR